VDKDDERYCHIFIKGCSGEDYTGFFQTAGYIEQNTVPVCDSEQYCIRKVLPSFISEERHQIACIPKFNTCFLIAMYYKIKLCFNLTNSPFIHYPSSSVFSISFFALS